MTATLRRPRADFNITVESFEKDNRERSCLRSPQCPTTTWLYSLETNVTVEHWPNGASRPFTARGASSLDRFLWRQSHSGEGDYWSHDPCDLLRLGDSLRLATTSHHRPARSLSPGCGPRQGWTASQDYSAI